MEYHLVHISLFGGLRSRETRKSERRKEMHTFQWIFYFKLTSVNFFPIQSFLSSGWVFTHLSLLLSKPLFPIFNNPCRTSFNLRLIFTCLSSPLLFQSSRHIRIVHLYFFPALWFWVRKARLASCSHQKWNPIYRSKKRETFHVSIYFSYEYYPLRVIFCMFLYWIS